MKILSLFPNQQQAGDAVEEMTSQEPLAENVSIEFVKAASPEDDSELATRTPTVMTPVAPTGGGSGMPGMGLLPDIEKIFSKFNISQEERAFIDSTVRNGGQLVIVETDSDYHSQAKSILQKHDARAVHTSG